MSEKAESEQVGAVHHDQHGRRVKVVSPETAEQAAKRHRQEEQARFVANPRREAADKEVAPWHPHNRL